MKRVCLLRLYTFIVVVGGCALAWFGIVAAVRGLL